MFSVGTDKHDVIAVGEDADIRPTEFAANVEFVAAADEVVNEEVEEKRRKNTA